MLLLLKNLLFTVLVPGTVAVYVPMLLRERAAANFSATGVPLLVIGAAIYAWCVWDFATRGRGTPAPIDPPKRLVVSGPYRWSRNPMYLGVLAAIGGWALAFRSPTILLYGTGVAVCFQLFVLLYEEPHLTRVFGEEYARYRAQVGRWLSRRPAPPG